MIDSVLLIRPRAIGKKEFPFGLLYVGTSLEKKGYKVKIVDLQDEPEKENYILDILKNSKNTILGISALAPHYRWVKEFTLKLKKIAPHTSVVIGGHIAALYEILLLKTGADYVCSGEGEELFPELIEAIDQGKPLDSISGLAFKEGGKIIKTAWRHYVKNFLLPDYELIDINKYLIHPSEDLFFSNSPEYQSRRQEDDKLGAIIFSRGCIGSCGFCYRHLPGFRQASIEWSWKHLMLLYKKYGVKYFRIDDELFINDQDWFKEFYDRIVNSKLDILFRVTGLRVDIINEETLKMLKEMGCIAVNYGIESGSQEILNQMNKRTTTEQNLMAIKNTIKAGMQVMAYVIIGYEKEDKKTLRETLSLLLDSGLLPEYLAIFYAMPLPGTKLYYDCIKNGKIKNEEEFLLNLAPYIEEKKEANEYYLINLSNIKVNDLIKWERLILLMLKLKQIFRNYPNFFNFLKKLFLYLPPNRFIISLTFKFLNLAKRLINKWRNNKKLTLTDYFNRFLLKILNKRAGYVRMRFYKKCKKLLSKSDDSLIILLSFDCDNYEDIDSLSKLTDFLDINGIKATFAVPAEIFIAGKDKFSALYKKGHDFIGHGYKRHSQITDGRYKSTFYYDKLSDEELAKDISDGNKILSNLLGCTIKGFRVPHFSHSNTKKELLRTYKYLKQNGIEFSSSTVPFFGILKGPLFKTYYSLYELPISGTYFKPFSILDTYSFGFSKYSNKENFKDYLDNFKKLIDFYTDKKVCLNLYSDPSQAVQMAEWFEAIQYAKEKSYKFMTISEFYEKYRN